MIFLQIVYLCLRVVMKREHQLKENKSIDGNLIERVQDLFSFSAAQYENREGKGAGWIKSLSLSLSELKTASDLIGFAHQHINNPLLTGLVFGHLAEKIRFCKDEIRSLSDQDHLKMEHVAKRSASCYSHYAANDEVQVVDLPVKLSAHCYEYLISALEKAIKLSNYFMVGQITSFIFIKKQRDFTLNE